MMTLLFTLPHSTGTVTLSCVTMPAGYMQLDSMLIAYSIYFYTLSTIHVLCWDLWFSSHALSCPCSWLSGQPCSRTSVNKSKLHFCLYRGKQCVITLCSSSEVKTGHHGPFYADFHESGTIIKY
jgi:hypothetical protein